MFKDTFRSITQYQSPRFKGSHDGIGIFDAGPNANKPRLIIEEQVPQGLELAWRTTKHHYTSI
ncbi:hypothetical protein [uncultured Shewanella sp.]|uniref:hypothetical protein n=1 Tax=uncultured Shewanella sp. TaxID=173975 RepID=UPI00261E7B6D|nr:hypothetical protein [uncultured Shewanella sp.]